MYTETDYYVKSHSICLTYKKKNILYYLLQEAIYILLNKATFFSIKITIFRIQERAEGGEVQELDQVILTALFRAQHLSPSEQLSLALTWNRDDIARSEIFVYGQEWPPGGLNFYVL